MEQHTTATERLWAVVPAGGAGTRLWPLSRAGRPKFLLDLTGAGRSLLQQTVDRLEPLVGDRVVVVTGRRHERVVRGQLPVAVADRVLAEPSPRDSMAAIGLAAARLERADPDALLGSFAADHAIADPVAFRACVTEAAALADTGRIVTIGIEPTHPSTAFGYVRVGERIDGFATAREVLRFVEKPDAERAAAYLAAGDHRWNAGMFVARASVLLDELAREHPVLAGELRRIAAEPALIEELWPELTAIAIDHAVAEPAADRGLVATVPGAFGWDDVGDYDSLAGLLAGADLSGADLTGADPAGAGGGGAGPERADSGVGPEGEPAGMTAAMTVLGDPGRVLAVRSTGLVVTGPHGAEGSAAEVSGAEVSGAEVPAMDVSGAEAPTTDRLIAVVGLRDVVVVDTGDALLVTDRAHAQEVKAVVAALREAGRDGLV